MAANIPPQTMLLILLCVVQALPRTSGKCYYPAGAEATRDGNTFTPCNSSAPASMCCYLSGIGQCTTHGLCLDPLNGIHYRDACTDQSWRSPECVKLCVGYYGFDAGDNHVIGVNQSVEITPCENGSFCCGLGSEGSTCCDQGKGKWIKEGRETNVNPNATAQVPTFSATTTRPGTTATATPSITSNPVPRKPLHPVNISMIAGSATGGGIALILIVSLLCWNIRLRRHSKRVSTPQNHMNFVQPEEQPNTWVEELTADDRAYETDGMHRFEAADNDRPYEADGMQRYEIPSNIDQTRRI